MPVILPIKNISPSWGANCFIAPNATLVGDVKMGNDCSVWFNAVVRGDVNSIAIGDKVNIQDGAIIHCTYEKASTHIGNCVNIGHRALIHGCTLMDYTLIGMGAIIMDHAVVQSQSIVAAGAVVLENTIIESGFIYAGTPAKKIKALTEEQKKLLLELPHRYMMYASWLAE